MVIKGNKCAVIISLIGTLKLTDSSTIMRHIARKYDLLGQNEEESALADLIVAKIADIRKEWIVIYDKDYVR